MDVIALTARITGRVQGVSFRAWTRAEAERRGLSGWVRNEPDGSVRALIVGPARDVDDMVRDLHKGPRAARVTAVVTEPADPDPDVEGFRITY
ncbi:acylphosphatase [Ruegeria sediminis]|uniref:Acylphosphatase n=1 Tax=Ruegeria sediminis TaxID=2583820 RepID=A0ABY2WT80_9RHOB|nr:acylphosphatase [Ruegeria sediminis]TMV03330.1 acylphosphatase [Ruegeria sediminis]